MNRNWEFINDDITTEILTIIDNRTQGWTREERLVLYRMVEGQLVRMIRDTEHIMEIHEELNR